MLGNVGAAICADAPEAEDVPAAAMIAAFGYESEQTKSARPSGKSLMSESRSLPKSGLGSTGFALCGHTSRMTRNCVRVATEVRQHESPIACE